MSARHPDSPAYVRAIQEIDATTTGEDLSSVVLLLNPERFTESEWARICTRVADHRLELFDSE